MPVAPPPSLFADLPAVAARAVDLRHTLHQTPELAYQEQLTAKLVSRELTRLGIAHQTGLAGGTGIVALIPGRAPTPSNRCVALRADLDALPIAEETGVPYASQRQGVMHACGHDGHTAILLGAAAILQAHADQFSGIVKLLFQPAEEGGCGADRMVQDGVLENPKVEAIFGLHGWPGLKVGTVATRPGALLASVDGFTVRLRGRGGHAAAPQDAIDPILCAAAVIQSMQAIVSRETEPTDPCVLTVSQINGGTAFNVIPDHVELHGTIRALSKGRRKATIAALERITRGIAAGYRCDAIFEYFGATPVTANTAEEAEFIKATAQRALGAKNFVEATKPSMWGEDFAFFLDHVPGCFFMLGVQPADRETYPMLHHPKYDFTDAAVPVGIRMMTEAALGWLARR
jgi:amidohydrolase